MPPVKRSAEFNRRTALKLLASAMAVTVTRCSRPDEEIVPYADMPEGMVAGEPMRFATTLSLSGYARGVLAISVDGHPTKIEGNPRHPFSLGATDVFSEAEVLSLYDPDRSATVRQGNNISTWDAFGTAWNAVAETLSPSKPLALVTGRITSPTTLAQVDALRRRFPDLRHYCYEPIHDDSSRAGARLAFGQVVTALPRWADADAILALGADPLGHGPDQLRIAHAFGARRGKGKRQRLHVVESGWTLTGAAADFRAALAPAQQIEIARMLANALGANLGAPQLPGSATSFATRAVRELLSAKGRALVLAGESLPAEAHAICHWINDQLHAPVDHLSPQDPIALDHAASVAALADDLHAHRVGAVIVAGANPVYDAPDALKLADAIASAPFSAHLGLYRDETAAACQWHLPLAHALETWGDACALDGTASLVQPLIQRLYDSRTIDEALAFLGGKPAAKAYDLVRATWRPKATSDFEKWWRQALQDGAVADSAAHPISVSARAPQPLPAAPARALTLTLAPDPSVWDGRFANNAWLQECAKPFSKQVWGNAVEMAPTDAQRMGIADQDTIDIEVDGDPVTAVALVVPGQAPGVIDATIGLGRTKAGKIGDEIGTRFSGLGTHPLARVLPVADLRKSSSTIPFRSTQTHTRLVGRAEDLFQTTTLAHANDRQKEAPPPSLLGIPPRGEYAWAMVIDTDACIGCNACVVACQAENNVPVVGPEEITRGRDMHWLRVDSYAPSSAEDAQRGFQPVPCMHCELAPCEPVCPVEASVHDHGGLNVQVYNRCIGTRFCEANCPYKVRRFNWFEYAGDQAYAGQGAALKAQHNPDVSSRPRGVMEKCNYCLQRINRARKTAEKERREVAEGEVVTACQAACPTRAIHFGDLNHKEGDISQQREQPRHYTLLAELNTRPRTTYLKRVYNSDEEPT